MVAFNKFNATVEALAEKKINLETDTIKILLTNTLPVATNSTYSDVSAAQVANGNGYTTGGQAVTVSSSGQSSGLYKLILSGTLVWTATGGSIGPFRYAIAYSDTAASKDLLGWWDYSAAITLLVGETLTVTFDGTNGLIQLQ